jgi:hypothetical protein
VAPDSDSRYQADCTKMTMLTLGDRFFAVTTPDTNAIDDIALLCFVAQTAGLVRTRRSGSAVYNIQLAVFPASVEWRE